MAERYLRAIVRAEAFVASRPDEGLAILAKHLKTDVDKLRTGVKDVGYQRSLSQALIVTMDEQARWVQRRACQPEAPANMLQLIDQNPLRECKPQAVSMIR